MNHYIVLNLPSPSEKQQNGILKVLDPEGIKQAYRVALLTHHPDKKSSSSPQTPKTYPPKPSIDAIKLAYTTLSDPESRAEYDRELILRSSKQTASGDENTQTFRIGEELIDLDDLAYDEIAGIWYRACRCGEKRGFMVTEAQLEEEERKGAREVVVGCTGCSLWLRVAFEVAEDQSLGNG